MKELFNFRNIDCFNKMFNLVWFPREGGKTTKNASKAFKWSWSQVTPKEKRGTVIFLYRYENEINLKTLQDLEDIYNEFQDRKVIDKYGKTGLLFRESLHLYRAQTGRHYISFKFHEGDKEIGGVLLWLGAKIEILKKLKINNVKYIFFDEYVLKPDSEKYLKDEMGRVLTFITTIQRYCVKNEEDRNKIKVYFTGNTYTKTNPFVEYFKIDENKIKPGCRFHGENWAVYSYKLPRWKIRELKNNPAIMGASNDFKEFIYGGNSALMKLVEKLIIKPPKRSFLRHILYINKNFFDIKFFHNEEGKNCYYVQNVKKPLKTWKKPIYCFDKLDLAKDIGRYQLISDIKKLDKFINALNKNRVFYSSECSYFNIYNIFQSYINTI